MKPACSTQDFIHLFETVGPNETARQLNIALTNVFKRRTNLEKKHGIVISSPNFTRRLGTRTVYPGRLEFSIDNGTIIVASDAHYWPSYISTAHRGLVWACKEFQPKSVILNGDELDGATISRHPPIGWEHSPTLVEEIETVKLRLDEITGAAPNAKFYWPLGNHDARFETRLATVAPEYAKIHGVHLQDHFPEFSACWSVWINNSVVVKHRWKGGIHAPWNNTIYAGKTIVTGHLHSGKVYPFTDYNGTRWGVDAGCIADPYGPQFEYLEDSPRNWRAGFAMLKFVHGELLPPELVTVWDEKRIAFRGELIKV